MSKKIKKSKQFKAEEVKVFKQFKKEQLFKQVSFVFVAMVVGFGINTLVLDWDFWNNLKANLLETSQKQNIEKQSDIYIKKTDWEDSNLMKIKTNKNIDKVKSLSFSFIYNPKKVEIQDIFPNIDTTRIQNEEWITTFIINFEKAKNFKKLDEILNFYISKKTWDSQNLNLINANFTDDTWIKYDLTTSWIIF